MSLVYPQQAAKASRRQIKLPERAYQLIEEMKDLSGASTKTGALERCLMLYTYLLRRKQEGGRVRIFVEGKNDSVQELAFPEFE